MAGQERRRLVVLGSVLGLLVAVFVARAFFAKDDSSKSLQPKTSATTVPGPFTPKPNGTTTSVPTPQPPPPTFPVYGSKNPFEPVIQVTPSTSTTQTTSNTATTTHTTHTTQPGGTTSTTSVPSNNPDPGQTVTLIDVFRDSNGTVQARVQVGSTVYTVGEGDTFAGGTYRVVSLDAPCGQFLFGDARFSLCEGEQTLK